MKALILSAGLGTRLRPITDKIPKSLVPINKKPLLSYHLESLKYYGIESVLVNTHYLNDQVESFVYNYNKNNTSLKVETIYEKELLGSAGTLKANKSFFDNEDDMIVIYGDNLTCINYESIIDFHKKKKALVTIAAYIEPRPETKGIIVFDNDKRITKFIEKPKPEQIVSNYANAGIYVINRKIFKYLFDLDKALLDFGYDIFPYLISKNQPMFIYEMNEFLLDIGTPESYNKAQELAKGLNFYGKRE